MNPEINKIEVQKQLSEKPEVALDNLRVKIDMRLDLVEKLESKEYQAAVQKLKSNPEENNHEPQAKLRAVSKILGAEVALQEHRNLAIGALEKVSSEDFCKWVEKNPEMVTPLRALPASVLLSPDFAKPEKLRALFMAGDTVDFHGNLSAKKYLGAGDLFGQEHQFIKINGEVGIRSIDSKFNKNKIGYINEDGDYLAILGGEEISFDVDDSEKADFSDSKIDNNFEYKNGETVLKGEAAYQAQFAEVVGSVKEEDRNYNEEEILENIDNSDNLKGEALWLNSGFQKKLREVCSVIGVNPEHMKVVMNAESGINPRAINSESGATGLIQFMPDTARALGTSVEELRQMSGVDQLEFVEKYFRHHAGKINSPEDLYMATFFPIGLGRPDDWVLRSKKLSARAVWRANKGIAPGKGRITVGDFKAYVRRKKLNT